MRLTKKQIGGLVTTNIDRKQLRKYLLGGLPETDEAQVEERLLRDADFAEAFEIIEEELIDRFLRDTLPAKERMCLKQNFFKSPERQQKLRFLAAFNQQRPQPLPGRHLSQNFLRFYLPLAAGLLLILSLGVWQIFFHQRPSNKGLIALQTAFRNQRPLEARLSGFSYAPLLNQRGAPQQVDYVQRDRAASILFNEVSDDPNAASYHALGVYYLTDRQFDKAIDQFEKALALDPQNAQVHAELGAALLEKGKANSVADEGQGIEEFARSLEHLNRALEKNPSLLEALFNRALLYEYMLLPRQAEDDWRSYLEKDANSKWANEAREKLKALEAQKNRSSQSEVPAVEKFLNAYQLKDDEQAWDNISRSYSSAGNAVTNAILDSYLDLAVKGEDDAARGKLQALEYIGRLEIERASDRHTSELARFYQNTNRNRLPPLSLARAQMRSAYELFTQSQIDEAINSYQQARQTFEAAGDDAETILAEYRLGHCYLLKPDLEKSEKIFERLRSTCEQKHYKWLLSQSLYRTASIKLSGNEFSKAIDYANQSLELAEQIPDAFGSLWNLILLSDEYNSLNDARQSMRFLRRSLTLVEQGDAQPLQRWGIFTSIAFNLNSLNYHQAASEYQKEALRMALEMKRPLIVSRSYDYLGQTYGDLHLYDEALKCINLAFETSKNLSGESSGREMMANSALHAGDIYRQIGNYQQAIASYDQSIGLYDELNYPYFTYPAHKGKLLSYQAQGDDLSTEEELRTVLALFEKYRTQMRVESQRNTFFDVEQSIYDLAIDFTSTKKQDQLQAFNYSELSRARSLLDAMNESAPRVARVGDERAELSLSHISQPLSISDIQRRMPAQAQILQYAVLDDKLLIWVITRENFSVQAIKIESSALSEKIRAYVQHVKAVSDESEAQAAEQSAKALYDLLVKPVEASLDRGKLLCIVPDKSLHYLPFAALVSSLTGKYLMEDFRLETAPSASVFIACSEQAHLKARPVSEKLLSVGNPDFDRQRFQTLIPLKAAEQEAQTITDYYVASRLLLGRSAQEKLVRAESEKADVIHFALHYVVDDPSSMLSGLVLASTAQGKEADSSNDGMWLASEIYQTRLSRPRLVVLSACQTGVEYQYRGEGAVSIARTFIAAGVPVVVASLWPVDSESTAKLMVSFHLHRTHGHLSTPEALRQAQLELLNSDDKRYGLPYYWAAFTVIGGHSEF